MPTGLDDQGEPIKPGAKGWCMRARVPMPTGNNFVKRPKWKSDTDMTKVTKQEKTKLDKQMLYFQAQKRLAQGGRAVALSMEGRNMAM